VIHQIGELVRRLHAAEALMERAGSEINRCHADTTRDSIAAASIAFAQAKALTTELALDASTKLLELAGTRSTHPSFNLDRHWRMPAYVRCMSRCAGSTPRSATSI
jgi:alkylation response protein AidB-like acyl-CoA dehydrogenase